MLLRWKKKRENLVNIFIRFLQADFLFLGNMFEIRHKSLMSLFHDSNYAAAQGRRGENLPRGVALNRVFRCAAVGEASSFREDASLLQQIRVYMYGDLAIGANLAWGKAAKIALCQL
jgi:hypothetical protein